MALPTFIGGQSMRKGNNKSVWRRFRVSSKPRHQKVGKVETIAEYLARGGKVTVLPEWKPAPDYYNPAPRPMGWFD
jgi:hypothetical protein